LFNGKTSSVMGGILGGFVAEEVDLGIMMQVSMIIGVL
jgi:hypothetical protein